MSTDQVGEHTIKCAAADNAGNMHTAAVPYQVVYRFDGFLPPINNAARSAGSASIFKAKSTVPVKLQLKDHNGNIVRAKKLPAWILPAKGAPISAPIDETASADAATDGNNFRWDDTNQQYIYNWKTKNFSAGYYYRVGAILDDGTAVYADIGLR